MCKESGQGESIAFGNNWKGFYTVSEATDEDEAKEVNVPIFYYSLDTGNLKLVLKLMIYWYSNMQCKCRWMNAYSSNFNVTTGTKQG